MFHALAYDLRRRLIAGLSTVAFNDVDSVNDRAIYLHHGNYLSHYCLIEIRKIWKLNGPVVTFLFYAKVNRFRWGTKVLERADFLFVHFSSRGLESFIEVKVNFYDKLTHESFMHRVPKCTIFRLLIFSNSRRTNLIKQTVPPFLFFPLCNARYLNQKTYAAA